MGLQIKQPWRLKAHGILTLIAVFALAVQPVGGFVSSLVAYAAEAPFEVTTSCSSDRKVVLTTTTRQAELPGAPQDARNWSAAISYRTDFGSSSSQSLSKDDVDTWSKTTSNYSIPAGVAHATVIGYYTTLKNIGFGITLDVLHFYTKTLDVNYSEKTCESAPVADDASLDVNEGVAADGDVHVTDAEDTNLTYSVVENVTHGSLTFDTSNGKYTYKPNAQFTGSDSFTFKANDGYLDSNTATVSITVKPDETGPEIKNIRLNDKGYTSGMRLNKEIVISADIDDLNGINKVAFAVKAPTGTDLSVHNSSDIAASGDLTKGTDGRWTAKFDSQALANNYSADGSYELVITAKDNAQAKNSSTKDGLMLTFDNTAPSAPKISPDSGSKKGKVNITVTPAESTDSSINRVEAQATYNGAPVDVSSAWSGENGAYLLDTTGLMRGTVVTVLATAKDTVGNVSSEARVKYIVENNLPVLVVNHDSSTSSSSHTLTGSVNPTTATVVVYFNNAAYQAAVGVDGSWSAVIDVSELQRGRYSYTVFADAGYGNTVTSDAYSLQVGAPVGNGLRGEATSIIPVIPARTIAASGVADIFTQSDEDQGLPSRSMGDPSVKGESVVSPEKNTAALTPSTHGWQLFSIAWYWWLAVVAALIGAWWWLVAARRKAEEQA